MERENLIIAEFMGASQLAEYHGSKGGYSDTILLDFSNPELFPNKDNWPDGKRYWSSPSLQYHKDWSLLMPVVQEINKRTEWVLVMAMGYSYFVDEYGGQHEEIDEASGYEDIEDVHRMVVELLMWLKNQK